MRKTWEFEWAWIDGGFQPDVLITIDGAGMIETVAGRDVTRPRGQVIEKISGIAVPGFANVHSHAFQRGMAGLSEYRTAERDSFWTWRQLMYRFVERLNPDDCYVIARQLFIDMLKAGFTSVGEFHYLHNDHDGKPYLNFAEMSSAILAAAAETGIRICLIPALYQQAGFDQRPVESLGQRRFYLSIDDWLRLIETLDTQTEGNSTASVGAALHSLRAVDVAAAREALKGLAQNAFGGPIHMHVAEQQQEVDDCLHHTGKRPRNSCWTN